MLLPLFLLSNKSLSTCTVPDLWKKSSVIPVFKSGNKQDVNNYRPIALMGTIAKVLDSIIAGNLTEKLLINVIKEQHGFVKGRSTLTNLLIYNNYISKTLNEYNQVDSVCEGFWLGQSFLVNF